MGRGGVWVRVPDKSEKAKSNLYHISQHCLGSSDLKVNQLFITDLHKYNMPFIKCEIGQMVPGLDRWDQ